MQPSQLFAAIRDAPFAHSGLSLFRPVCLPAEPSCTAHCRLTSGEGSQNFMVTRIATGASLRGHRRWPPPPPASTATSLMLPGPTLLLHHCRSMDALDQLGGSLLGFALCACAGTAGNSGAAVLFGTAAQLRLAVSSRPPRSRSRPTGAFAAVCGKLAGQPGVSTLASVLLYGLLALVSAALH